MVQLGPRFEGILLLPQNLAQGRSLSRKPKSKIDHSRQVEAIEAINLHLEMAARTGVCLGQQ